ncbi:MAG: FkbM family methyltransferase [Bryobacteraceae bacterium]
MGWRDWLRKQPAGSRDYDRQTVAVMQRVLCGTSNCIDVGASAGELLKHMVRLAPRGNHFAFEPLTQFYRVLVKKFPGVAVHDVALSDTEETTASFQHVVSNPAYSGLKRRRYDRPGERVEVITVRTARLDELIPQNAPIRFIKIDVEGGEFQVLRGGRETVCRSRPFIVFEFGFGGADWYGVQPEDMYRLLSDYGLKVSRMSDWLSGKPSLSELEFAADFRESRDYYFLAHPRG